MKTPYIPCFDRPGLAAARLRILRRACAAGAVLGLALAATVPLHAQSGGIYTLTRSTIDAGGGRSTGGVYDLHGTIGQHDASAPLAGGNLVLQPGFWASTTPAVPPPPLIFRNGFESPP
jgi:hypothetical protein